MGLTRTEIEMIVDERLLRLGIDSNRPLDAQKDFQYLRYIHSGSTALKAKIIMSIVGALALGGGSAAWIWMTT